MLPEGGPEPFPHFLAKVSLIEGHLGLVRMVMEVEDIHWWAPAAVLDL